MKQVLLRDGQVHVEEVPRPVAGPGRVLVRTAYSVISPGTERAALAGSASDSLLREAGDPAKLRRFIEVLRDEGVSGVRERLEQREHRAPEAPGYAAAGVVEAVGRGVRDLPPGTLVACAGAGYACHAEWLAVPRNLVAPVPGDLPLREAAFATLGAIALQGVRRAAVQIGESVVVLGLGLVGTLAAQIARAAGCRVIGFDRDPARAARCRDLGLRAFDLAARDPRDEVPRATAGLLADAVLVCAASPGSEVANLAMRLCRKKGKVVIVGDVGLALDRTLMYEKELDLLISTSYGPGRYDPAYEEEGLDYPPPYVRWTENRNLEAFLHLLASRRVDVRPLIDRTWPIAGAPAAYEAIATPGEGDMPLGVVLEYGAVAGAAPADAGVAGSPDAGVAAATGRCIEALSDGRTPIGVILCGAGDFVRRAHIPAIRSVGRFSLRSVVTARPVNAAEAARRYGIPRAAVNFKETLDDEAAGLVLIGTRHHLHAEQVRDALAAGKHVLVEKPLCLESTEIEPLVETARQARRLLAVGFNRRYSPLTRRAREVLSRLSGPSLAVYRVNAGPLPPGHWVHDPRQGGGRILGECGHFIDLLLHLTGETMVSIEARAVPSDGVTVVGSDAFAALFTLSRGSRATLIYNGMGDPGMGKERLEIFKGGASLVLDDFRSLTVHGAPGGGLKLRQQDKGVVEQWRAVGRALRGEPSEIITLDEVRRATEATFMLDRAVRGERCGS